MIKRIGWLTITDYPTTTHRARERAILDALPSLKRFLSGPEDAVILMTVSFLELDGRIGDRMFEAMARCKDAGLPFYFGRRLWGVHGGPLAQHIQRFADAPHIAQTCLRTLRAERAMLEAMDLAPIGLAVDTEPYNAEQGLPWVDRHGTWLKGGLTYLQVQQMLRGWRASMWFADAHEPPHVDLAYPGGGRFPGEPVHFSWITRELGQKYLNHCTYRMRDPLAEFAPPEVSIPGMTLPDGTREGGIMLPPRVTHIGSLLGAATVTHGSDALSVPEYVQVLASLDGHGDRARQRAEKFPDLEASWFCIEGGQEADVINQLAQ